MNMWTIRILFLCLCTMAGYAISQVRPESLQWPASGFLGCVIGAGFGWLLIALDEMLKGFSLRAFSATTFGLALGTVVAKLVDGSGLFDTVEGEAVRWIIRLCLFLGFGYIGIVLAMRSNKEDFSLIIPYVRFVPRHEPVNLLLLDTSVIIDGRITELMATGIIDGIPVVPRFVLEELQRLADSSDALKRERGKRGLDLLKQLQENPKLGIRIHEGDFPEEKGVDTKLIRLARNIGARLYTNDSNLARIASLQDITCVNLHEVARALRASLVPGEPILLRIAKEGRDKGQGVGYLPDGTMVVVSGAQHLVGREVEARVQSTIQTGSGLMVFADLRDQETDTGFISRA
jgi:uncharacterized protein YacL